MSKAITELNLPNLNELKKGKVRSLFVAGDDLVMVTSDRISAYDVVLPEGIPGKGAVLTAISVFWFGYLKAIVSNHLLSAKTEDFPEDFKKYHELLDRRSLLVRRTAVLPIECIVRGYLSGSGWKEYQTSGTVCGIDLPKGLKESARLPEPLFTPSTKAEIGAHDENISLAEARTIVGAKLAEQVRDISLALYKKASDYAESKGIIIADTKFEFGLTPQGELLLIDEVLTPDSSRFWPKDQYQAGQAPPSYDKQFVRDYLNSLAWDKNPPAPSLPVDIITKTAQKYQEIERILTR